MKILIMGGGTFSDVTPHLSLCTRAFGTTAKQFKSKFHELNIDSDLMLTKMADVTTDLVTNKDVEKYIDHVLTLPELKAIIFNVAMCDFTGTVQGYPHTYRLSSNGSYGMRLAPDINKVITKIKQQRPDIFLVGFKTTAGDNEAIQIRKAERLISVAGCDLVLANDITTRNNLLVQPSFVLSGSRDVLLNTIVSEVIKTCYPSKPFNLTHPKDYLQQIANLTSTQD
jgi:hypothetical protein